MGLKWKNSQAGAIDVPYDTTNADITNRATSGTNPSKIGYVYALDHARAGSGVDSTPKAFSTAIALDASNGARGCLVVAKDAVLAGKKFRGCIKGAVPAYVYGNCTPGKYLAVDTTNGYLVVTTTEADVRAIAEGTSTTTDTDALTLMPVTFLNNSKF